MNCDRLRGIRCERRKTHDECAYALGLKAGTSYRIKEYGDSEFSVSQMVALVDFLHMTPTEVNEVFLTENLPYRKFFRTVLLLV